MIMIIIILIMIVIIETRHPAAPGWAWKVRPAATRAPEFSDRGVAQRRGRCS